MKGIVTVGLLLSSACSHHVYLQVPDTSPGARYTCRGTGECKPATTDVPSDLNRRGTVFVNLPRQCQGHIQRIVILDADSDEPVVDVTCAPIEEPIQPMQ